jgi:hypothetical protein
MQAGYMRGGAEYAGPPCICVGSPVYQGSGLHTEGCACVYRASLVYEGGACICRAVCLNTGG